MTTKRIGSSGMNDGMARKWGTTSVDVGGTVADCQVLDMRAVADCLIQVPTGVTALTFYSCEEEGGTFGYIKDKDGNPAVLSVTGDDGKWIQFPPAVFAAGFVKIVSTGASGTAKIQGKG